MRLCFVCPCVGTDSSSLQEAAALQGLVSPPPSPPTSRAHTPPPNKLTAPSRPTDSPGTQVTSFASTLLQSTDHLRELSAYSAAAISPPDNTWVQEKTPHDAPEREEKEGLRVARNNGDLAPHRPLASDESVPGSARNSKAEGEHRCLNTLEIEKEASRRMLTYADVR